MPKKAIFGVSTVALLIVVGFVVNEMVLFYSTNPYGAKEISPDFEKSLPPSPPSTTEDFFTPSSHPISDREASRMALEFTQAKMDTSEKFRISGISHNGFDRTFIVSDVADKEVRRVHVDRLGRFTFIEP